ncbi:MAG: 2-hydroxychromene-2-carboxylate isomerase [Labilithrix sp.]|nr:2-hydroxychromene-2-carboxylate isomerase [Labilithrix sp.]
MDAPPAPLLFHFDFISPYAFLAWTQIRRISAQAGRTVRPVPVLFAALLDSHGQKGPAEIPAKRRYLFKDVARKAHRLGVPSVAPPPAHPFNPLLALRVASLPLAHDAREAVIDALYAAAWTKRQAIDTADAVTSVLTSAGLDGPGLVAAAATPEAKATLRSATDAAIARGVFGVPSIVLGDELFWGTDSLADLEAHLRGELPPFPDAGWSDLPAAAVRKGSLRS